MVAMVQLVSLYTRVSSLPWILSLIVRPRLHLLECFFFCHVQGVTKCPNSATYYKLYYISIRVRVIVLIYIRTVPISCSLHEGTTEELCFPPVAMVTHAAPCRLMVGSCCVLLLDDM